MEELEGVVMQRIGLAPDRANRDTEMEAWHDWRDEYLIQWDADKATALNVEGYVDPTAAEPPAQTEYQYNLGCAAAKTQMARNAATSLETSIKAAAGEDFTQPLSHQQFITFSKRLAEVQRMMSVEIKQGYDAAARADSSKTAEVVTALQTDIAEINTLFTSCQDVISKVKYEEGALAALNTSLGLPVAHSTGLDASFAGSGVIMAAASPYQEAFTRSKPMVFDGAYRMYPRFKQEWKEGVRRGKTEAHFIRLLSEAVPSEDKDRVASKQTEEALWDYLDRKYSNAGVITSKVLSELWDLKELTGVNAPQRVVDLKYRLDDLHQTLSIINTNENSALNQLIESQALINKSVSLLPTYYRREFDKYKDWERQRLGKSDDYFFPPKEMYKLLTRWLARQENYFMADDPDSLKQKKAPAQAGGGQHQGGRGHQGALGINVQQTNPFSAGDDGRGGGGGGRASQREPPPEPTDRVRRSWERIGPCPACKEPGHVWMSSSGPAAATLLKECPVYKQMSPDDKIAIMQAVPGTACFRCTSWLHNRENCTRPEDGCERLLPDGSLCGGDHHKYLHGNTIGINLQSRVGARVQQWSDEETEMIPNTNVMMPVMPITLLSVVGGKVETNVLLDGGSSSSCISYGLADKLGLKGREAWQLVELCGRKPELIQVRYYHYQLPLSTGETRDMVLVGLPRISTCGGSYDVSAAYQVFPHHKYPALEKPTEGEIGMLIGADYPSLLPGGGEGTNQVDDLRVFSVPWLSPGVVLVGHHPLIEPSAVTFSSVALNWRQAVFYPCPHSASQLNTSISTSGRVQYEVAENIRAQRVRHGKVRRSRRRHGKVSQHSTKQRNLSLFVNEKENTFIMFPWILSTSFWLTSVAVASVHLALSLVLKGLLTIALVSCLARSHDNRHEVVQTDLQARPDWPISPGSHNNRAHLGPFSEYDLNICNEAVNVPLLDPLLPSVQNTLVEQNSAGTVTSAEEALRVSLLDPLLPSEHSTLGEQISAITVASSGHTSPISSVAESEAAPAHLCNARHQMAHFPEVAEWRDEDGTPAAPTRRVMISTLTDYNYNYNYSDAFTLSGEVSFSEFEF